MDSQDLHLVFSVDQSPEAVFNAINTPDVWWDGIEGDTTALNDEFVHQYKDAHYCKIKITEFDPGKKVVWHVLDSRLSSMKDPLEWSGTDIVFEIAQKDGKTELRFTHKGLTPQLECYNACVGAWTMLIVGNLQDLITKEQG